MQFEDEKHYTRDHALVDALMPDTEEDKRILRERMEQISKQTTDKIQYEDGNTYVCFTLGKNELYGIPYHYIKEVLNSVNVTKLPCTNKAIAGIINRRGALLAVVDLKQLFNFSDISYEKKPYILIIKSSDMTIGILSDKIIGSAMYDSKNLDVPLSFSGAIKPEYILGLHNGKIAILNVEAILSDLGVLTR